MADYAQLESMVGALKRAAVDAWFHQEYAAVVQVDRYEFEFGSGTIVSVTRPGADGSGGGVYSVVSTPTSQPALPGQKAPAPADFTAEFQTSIDNIRQRIEAAISKWRDLPDPAVIDDEIETIRSVTRDLAVAPITENGRAVGAGKIGGYLKLVESDLNEMSGDTIETFKALFLVQLSEAVAAFDVVSRLIGVAIAGERTLWQHAREDVAAIVAEVTKALDSYARSGSSGSWKVGLQLLTWVSEAVEIFGMGGLKALEAASNLTLSVLNGTQDGALDKGSDGSGNYDSLMAGLEKRLIDLNAELVRAETDIETNLSDNYREVHNERDSFDLTLPVISSSRGLVFIHEPLVHGLVHTTMPLIAGVLRGAASTLNGATISISRSAAVGTGSSGPAVSWYEMTILLYQLCTDLAWKVEMGAKDLELAIEDMHQHDDASAARLRAVVNQISFGSGNDPYQPRR